MKISDSMKNSISNIIKEALENNGFDVLPIKGGVVIPWAKDGEEGSTKIVLSTPKGQLIKGEGYTGFDPYEESQNYLFEEEEKKKKKAEALAAKEKKIKKDKAKREKKEED